MPSIEEWLDKMRNYAMISTLSRQIDLNTNEDYQESWDAFFQYLSISLWTIKNAHLKNEFSDLLNMFKEYDMLV